MPTRDHTRKRGRPRNSPRKSNELLDELARLGCDREYIQLVAGTLADWNWGSEKWHPPRRCEIAALGKAERLLETMKTDFFFRHLWMKPDEENWEHCIAKAQFALSGCKIGIQVISLLFRSKPNGRRYILTRALIEHIKAKTGQPRFAQVAELLTQLNASGTRYDTHKLQMQYKRAQHFLTEFGLSQRACAAFQKRNLRRPEKFDGLAALEILMQRS